MCLRCPCMLIHVFIFKHTSEVTDVLYEMYSSSLSSRHGADVVMRCHQLHRDWGRMTSSHDNRSGAGVLWTTWHTWSNPMFVAQRGIRAYYNAFLYFYNILNIYFVCLLTYVIIYLPLFLHFAMFFFFPLCCCKAANSRLYWTVKA